MHFESRHKKRRKWFRMVGVVFSMTLFAAALFVIHNELKEYKIHDIISELRSFPPRTIIIAILLTILNYVVMTGYDFLAFRYIRHPISYGKIAAASFISYAFSNNMGFIMLSGAPVRYRLYTAWGLSAGEIASVVVFCTLSLWLGFLALGGIVFLWQPFTVPAGISFRTVPLHTMGGLFAGIVVWYLFFSFFKKKPLRIGGWNLPLIPFRLSVFQISVSAIDWALSAAILYLLLPADFMLSYPSFTGIFMLAQVTGLASNVPGGLGVFESVMILFLSPYSQTSAILGALLAYRGIYYLVPLFASSIILGIFELFQSGPAAKKILASTGRAMTAVSPHFFALTTFIGGAVLLVSGSTPAAKGRISLLMDFLPLPVIEISHFLGSIAGTLLILLARSLQRKIYSAYVIASILLAAGAVFSILKGFDYEEAVVLTLMFLMLFSAKRRFYRKAFIIDQRFTPGWISSISLLLILSIWIGFFSFRHVEYSHDLWWHFTFYGDAPRFLRACVGTGVFMLLFLIIKLLHPYSPEPSPPDAADIASAKAAALSSKYTYSYLSLLGDKSFLFSAGKNTFIMYQVQGRSWVAMGDPVGAEDEKEDLIWTFNELSDRYGGRTVFYEVGEENMHYYADMGLSFVKLGEEGRVNLATFTLEGSRRKEMRYIMKKLEREGCSFDVIKPEEITTFITRFKKISDTWLREKNAREMGFSLGFFSEDYLKLLPAAVVKKDSDIVAFANIWPGAGKEELSIDLMRYLPGAPHGIMDYLFTHLMLWGKQQGYQWFSLGMAPFSGFENRSFAPLWNRIGALIFRYGEHFYNFKGLRQYKEKFGPEWKPKFLAYPGIFTLPRVLADIASLVSRGPNG